MWGHQWSVKGVGLWCCRETTKTKQNSVRPKKNTLIALFLCVAFTGRQAALFPVTQLDFKVRCNIVWGRRGQQGGGTRPGGAGSEGMPTQRAPRHTAFKHAVCPHSARRRPRPSPGCHPDVRVLGVAPPGVGSGRLGRLVLWLVSGPAVRNVRRAPSSRRRPGLRVAWVMSGVVWVGGGADRAPGKATALPPTQGATKKE